MYFKNWVSLSVLCMFIYVVFIFTEGHVSYVQVQQRGGIHAKIGMFQKRITSVHCNIHVCSITAVCLPPQA